MQEVPVKLEDVMAADELILTNVIQGANWISIFRGKSYENEYSIKLNGWLNGYIGEADSF